MGLVIFPIETVSIVAICIMIGALVVAYVKKWMMTYVIIITNFVVFILSLAFTREIIGELAFKPIYLSVEYFPQMYTLFTSMFLHSTYDFFHIIFNVLMFILIAPSFENRIGRNKFLGIYLITGVCAALFHAVIVPLISPPDSFNPWVGLIGASGAISGILGAYAYAYPRDRVFFPVGFFIMRIPILLAGIVFIAVQTLFIFIGGDPHVAYLAHIGGFISGVILAALLIGRQVKKEKKPRNINFSNLRELTETHKQAEMLKRIENETVPQVRDVWLEHFLGKTRCPKCGKTLNHLDGKIWCEECSFKTNY